MIRISANMVLLVDSIGAMLAWAYQLVRARLASVASPVMRILCQRDHAKSELELLRREPTILRASRQSGPAHPWPKYQAEQRLAILQLKRHRNWSV